MIARLAAAIATRPGRALALVGALTLVMGIAARDVRLDNDFAALFSTSSSDARFREDYRRTFGADDGLLVAVISADEPSDAMYATVGAASRAVAAMPEVEQVDSVTTLSVVRAGAARAGEVGAGQAGSGAAVSFGPAFAPDTTDRPLRQRITDAAASDLGPGALISTDGRTTLVVGNLGARYDSYERVTGPAERFRTIVDGVVERANARADQDGADQDSLRVDYAGVAFTRLDAISEMQGDLLKLFPLATVMMALLLWWFFRRPAAVIAPMVAITVSVVCTAGVIGLAGDDINQVTIIYPVLLMGVVVSTATHLIHRFYRERAAGADAPTAARVTLERISRAAVVCTITNAIGFVSLLTAKMSILHEFGLYLAAGIGFCFVSTSVCVPAILVLRNSEPPARYLRSATPAAADSPDGWRRFARWITAPRSAAAVTAAGLLLVGVSIAVSSTASYDYSLSGMLQADRPASVGNRLIDTKLSGIVPIEISVRGERDTFERPDVLAHLATFRNRLVEREGLRTVGLPSVLDAATKLGAPNATLRDIALLGGEGAGVDRLVTPDRSWTRLRGFHPDTGASDIVALAHCIDAEGRRAFAGTGVTVRVTGEAPVAYAGMNELSRELILATIIAVVLIVVAIGLAFRSVTLALVALLPNVVPIAAGLALYTLAKDVLDPVAGVVFCIAMGLAADDTVHLINRYREVRANHATGEAPPSARDSLVEALTTVRRAMVSSSAVLIASFLALGVSGFPTNRTLGVLGSAVLVLALGSDLLFGTAGLALARRRA